MPQINDWLTRPSARLRAQEVCESQGGHPGLPKPTVSVDVKQHSTNSMRSRGWGRETVITTIILHQDGQWCGLLTVVCSHDIVHKPQCEMWAEVESDLGMHTIVSVICFCITHTHKPKTHSFNIFCDIFHIKH